MPIDESEFAVSCSATVTDEFELQLTKSDDNARNWMTMFRNWLTKDEIEMSIRTFQSVRDEIESTFFLYEEVTKMGGKTYIISIRFNLDYMRFHVNFVKSHESKYIERNA